MTMKTTEAPAAKPRRRGRDLPGRRGGYGRAKGTPNKVTVEIRKLAQSLTFDNPRYLERIRLGLENGTLDTALEIRILEYAHGKPPQKIELDVPESPVVAVARAFWESLSPEERKTQLDFVRRRRALAESTIVDVIPGGRGG